MALKCFRIYDIINVLKKYIYFGVWFIWESMYTLVLIMIRIVAIGL